MRPLKIYDVCHDSYGMTAYEWERDPKRLLFILSRYKFVARMLQGKENVLEVGCADGFGSRIVRQQVRALTAIDIDEQSIAEAKRCASPKWPIDFVHRDFLAHDFLGFDAVYCLDVFEHLMDEAGLLRKLYKTADMCVIGTPSLESQVYASELSKQGHINCKSGEDLRKACSHYWKHVMIFSMNDEVVHTGFFPMAHYLFAVCSD